jgi:hypothetical protein
VVGNTDVEGEPVRRLLIPLLVLVPVLAGCGGGAAKATNTASQSPTVTTATPANQPTVAPATTAAPQFSGNSGSSWCDLDRSFTDSFKAQNIVKDAHAWVNTIGTLLPQAEAKAPAAIKADVHTVAVAVRLLAQDLASNGYDFSKVTPAQLASFSSPALTAASERVTAYDKQVCGTNG